MILHISCHGTEAKVSSLVSLNEIERKREENSFLLFETSDGAGELVSAYELRQLIEKYNQKLNVVVVAACQSEFVGEIFLKCGARHVICIKTG